LRKKGKYNEDKYPLNPIHLPLSQSARKLRGTLNFSHIRRFFTGGQFSYLMQARYILILVINGDISQKPAGGGCAATDAGVLPGIFDSCGGEIGAFFNEICGQRNYRLVAGSTNYYNSFPSISNSCFKDPSVVFEIM
jgi:hypothetical protein